MRYLDQTLASPAENLALDEALLIDAEEGHGGEVLRLWESPIPFVVVGIGARVAGEVHLDVCRGRNIPVLRRCSGGGTVVQGPGCLSYTLVLRIPGEGPLTSIRGTNQKLMQQHADVLSSLIGNQVEVQGHTDLTVEGVKFSGNAQRRLRRHLLFHGTFLLNFDLSLISQLLPIPELQPSYRANRCHAGFVRNLELPAVTLKQALCREWGAAESAAGIPTHRMATLVEQRYGRKDWNFRR